MIGWKAMLGGALLFGVAALGMPLPAQAYDQRDPCGAETRRQERLQAIPDGLLTAIAHVESGRYDGARRALIAWPWTVMAEGKGRYLPSKAAAIAEVMALKGRGVRNIDVGCMQVNLQVHGEAFPDLDTAFDPRANVAYAARFLKDLQAETGSWATAGTHYHSRTPHLAARYRIKLATAWSRLQDGEPPRPAAPLSVSGRPPLDAGQLRPVVFRPLPAAVQQAAQRKAELAAERDAARRSAEAWRQQKLSEYHLRKVQQPNPGGIPMRP